MKSRKRVKSKRRSKHTNRHKSRSMGGSINNRQLHTYMTNKLNEHPDYEFLYNNISNRVIKEKAENLVKHDRVYIIVHLPFKNGFNEHHRRYIEPIYLTMPWIIKTGLDWKNDDVLRPLLERESELKKYISTVKQNISNFKQELYRVQYAIMSYVLSAGIISMKVVNQESGNSLPVLNLDNIYRDIVHVSKL